jgi:hypothetical protein
MLSYVGLETEHQRSIWILRFMVLFSHDILLTIHYSIFYFQNFIRMEINYKINQALVTDWSKQMDKLFHVSDV